MSKTPPPISQEQKLTETKGRTSPKWAFWERMTIPCMDGLVYLVRLRIIQTPWFALYLHDIHEPDGDRDPHNHPWPFLSFVLRGYYIEKVYDDPGHPRLAVSSHYVEKKHRRFSVHRMGRSSAHRIVEAAPGLKTIIITGPRSKDGWGFFVDGEYVPWQTYTRFDGTPAGAVHEKPVKT